jgi:hypothetical protein
MSNASWAHDEEILACPCGCNVPHTILLIAVAVLETQSSHVSQQHHVVGLAAFALVDG